MGYNICYIACKASVEEMGAAFDLTLQSPGGPPVTHGGRIARVRASGWTVLLCGDERFGEQRKEQIACLSEAFDTYLCEVIETVMWASAERWRDGQPQWKVAHAGDGDDRFDLTVTGTPPVTLAPLREKYEALQREDGEEVDYIFEIPLELAAEEIGFRHDAAMGAEDAEEVMDFLLPRRKGFLARLFGR